MTRGYKNNNPLNIRQNGELWQGEIRPSQDSAFKQFESMAWGYRAAFRLLDNYRRLHGCRILSDFIGRWAPPVENDTRRYIDMVAKRARLSDVSLVNTRDEITMRRIVSAMSFVENGIEADAEQVRQGWDLFIWTSV